MVKSFDVQCYAGIAQRRQSEQSECLRRSGAPELNIDELVKTRSAAVRIIPLSMSRTLSSEYHNTNWIQGWVNSSHQKGKTGCRCEKALSIALSHFDPLIIASVAGTWKTNRNLKSRMPVRRTQLRK